MALKEEGVWGCTVLSGKSGETDKGALNVQINVVIDDGPSKGMRCTYEDTVNAKSAKYIDWSCTAAGWRGDKLATLETDINAWIAKTGGKTTVEIRHVVTRKGTPDEGIWDKVNGLGRGAAKPLRTASAATLADADAAMRDAKGGGYHGEDAPPPGDEDIRY